MGPWQYEYLDPDSGISTTVCPSCFNDLTKEDGVEVHFTDGINSWMICSCLDSDGTLNDPTGCVAKGLHSFTACAGCHQLLIDLGIEEREVGVTDGL